VTYVNGVQVCAPAHFYCKSGFCSCVDPCVPSPAHRHMLANAHSATQNLLTNSYTHSLTHSFIYSSTRVLTHPRILSLAHSFTHQRALYFTHAFSHSLIIHSLINTLSDSPPHIITSYNALKVGSASDCISYRAYGLDASKLFPGQNSVAVRVTSPGGKAGAPYGEASPGWVLQNCFCFCF